MAGQDQDTKGDGGWRDTIVQVLATGAVAAILSIFGNYFVNYRLIEKPKIDSEARSELNKLTPIVTTECSAVSKDAWTWGVVCVTKNNGAYPVVVSVDRVSLVQRNEYPKRKIYDDGQGFKVTFLDDQQSYFGVPTSSGGLEAYVVFDKKSYPNGVGNVLDALVNFKYQTPSDRTKAVVAGYSQIDEDDAAERSHTAMQVEVSLPQWNPAPQAVPSSAQPTSAPAPQTASATQATSDSAAEN